METMGTRIRRLREARGLTQQGLADLCAVTKSAVSQWEADSTADIKLKPFLALCGVLGTDPYYLVLGPERAAPGAPTQPQRRIQR